LSPEMTPTCKFIVYHVSPDDQILADSVDLPVHGVNRVKLSVTINKNQDRSGNFIEIVPNMDLGSIIGLNAYDFDLKDLQGYNDITPTKATMALHKFEKGKQKKVIWRNRDGRNERVSYYPTHNRVRDTEATFAVSSSFN